MPWNARSATRKTKRARSPKRKRQWAKVANSALRRGASEASAIRQANAAVKAPKKTARRGATSRRRRRR